MDTRKRMRITAAEQTPESITVQTTGARYVFDTTGKPRMPASAAPDGHSGGSVLCTQLVNGPRNTARIDFDVSFERLTLESPDIVGYRDDLHAACVLNTVPIDSSCAFVRIEVHRDSLLEIYTSLPMQITITSDLRPEYHADTKGHLLLIDELGGIGMYPHKGMLRRELLHTGSGADKEWQVRYHLERDSRFLFSVFPPREFETEQYYGEQIVHHGTIQPWVVPPFPTDEMIRKASEFTTVLVLHEGLWEGKLTRAGKPIETVKDLYADASYASHNFKSADEKELVRTIRTAHKLGMKVIPYMSPFFSSARGKVYWQKARERLDHYEMDGLYFDGVSRDIMESYEVLQNARDLVGDGNLYVHCTGDPVSRNVFCPFIDAYADYILRAEHATMLSDAYLRYVISGYNVSNSIGHLCYYDFPEQELRAVIEKALAYRFRFYLGSPETDLERVLLQEYFPRLKQEAKVRHAGVPPGIEVDEIVV